MENNETVANHSAFPCQYHESTWGMTKREYFAAMALQGMLANPNINWSVGNLTVDAVDAADRLIDQLNKNKQ